MANFFVTHFLNKPEGLYVIENPASTYGQTLLWTEPSSFNHNLFRQHKKHVYLSSMKLTRRGSSGS